MRAAFTVEGATPDALQRHAQQIADRFFGENQAEQVTVGTATPIIVEMDGGVLRWKAEAEAYG